MKELINNKGERKRTDGTPRRITSSRILIQWNDSPKEETSFHDMPEDLRESFDRWLSLIEDQENAKNGL
jgi:Fe-S cluster assembly scaffold protein SufB